MMTETDAEFIARMRALAEKATPGEWIDCNGFVRPKADAPFPYGRICAYATDQDSAFIAAARTAIPRLIGMVKEREHERDAAREKYDEHFIKRIMGIPDADLLALIPKDERDAAVVQGKQAVKIGILTVERDAAIARAEAAESAQPEAVAEVARLREAGERLLRTIDAEGIFAFCREISRFRAALASEE